MSRVETHSQPSEQKLTPWFLEGGQDGEGMMKKRSGENGVLAALLSFSSRQRSVSGNVDENTFLHKEHLQVPGKPADFLLRLNTLNRRY